MQRTLQCESKTNPLIVREVYLTEFLRIGRNEVRTRTLVPRLETNGLWIVLNIIMVLLTRMNLCHFFAGFLGGTYAIFLFQGQVIITIVQKREQLRHTPHRDLIMIERFAEKEKRENSPLICRKRMDLLKDTGV